MGVGEVGYGGGEVEVLTYGCLEISMYRDGYRYRDVCVDIDVWMEMYR